jgi:hypothetical protein
MQDSFSELALIGQLLVPLHRRGAAVPAALPSHPVQQSLLHLHHTPAPPCSTQSAYTTSLDSCAVLQPVPHFYNTTPPPPPQQTPQVQGRSEGVQHSLLTIPAPPPECLSTPS